MSDIRFTTDLFLPDVMGAGTDFYETLSKWHRLKVITTDEELDKAIAMAGPLFKAYELLDQNSKDYLQVLSLLIQEYENKHHKIDTDDLDPIDALKFLMEEHDLNQSDIARILDSERGLVSEIMSGKKNISKAKAVILAKHFNTDVGMFINEAKVGVRLGPIPTSLELFEVDTDEPVYLLESSDKTARQGTAPSKRKKKKKTKRAERPGEPNRVVKPGSTSAKKKKRTRAY